MGRFGWLVGSMLALAASAMPFARAQTDTQEAPAAPAAAEAPAPAQPVDQAAAPESFTAIPESAQARELIAAGRPEQAFALLAPLEARWAGDSEYDYLIGVAALDAGRLSEAVLSLQRAVTGAPSFAGARMDLARAYFALGDNEDARREFEILRSQDPPPQVAAVIEQYLQAVDQRAQRYRPVWRGLVEFASGYDSNANGGSSADRFLGFELNEASRRAESSFAAVNAGVEYGRPLRPRWRWLSGLHVGHRELFDARFVSATEGGLNTGLAYSSERLQVSVAASGRWLALDGEENQRTAAADLGLQWLANDQLAYLASARLATLRYDEAVRVQDVDQWIGALGLWWRPRLGQRLELQFGPLAGREQARESGSPYGRDLVGARLSLVSVYRGLIGRASLGRLHSEYEGRFFGAERSDDQTSATLGLEIPRLFDAWALQPQLGYVDNRSDVSLFEYERFYVSLALTRSF